MEKLIKMKKVILRLALVFALFTCVLFICNQCANRTVYLTIVEPLNYKDNDIMVNSSMNGCIEFNAPNDSLDCWFYFKLSQSVSNLDVKAMEFEIDECNICIHKDINKNIEIKEGEDCVKFKYVAYFMAKNYITIKDIENEFKKNKFFLTSRHSIFSRFNKVNQVKIKLYLEYEKNGKNSDVACSFSYSTENRTSLKIIDILKS